MTFVGRWFCSMSHFDVNPYESTVNDNAAVVPIRTLAANTSAVCCLLLVGFPLFTACTFMHSCMCGHLQHVTSTMLPFHIALDIALGLVFLAAAYVAFSSTMRHRKTFAVLLAMIYLDHVVLANGAGYFFILIDAPTMIFIAMRCFICWRHHRTDLLAPDQQ